MSKVKFSIIVPVYGTEKYIHQCIDSILKQSYTDFEVILVDDKSPDACPTICDDYKEQDARVVVIHKSNNEGLGEARNTGVSFARGEYVAFVDSDDTISENCLYTLAEKLKDDTEILVSGITLCYENKDGNISSRDERSLENEFAYTSGNLPEAFFDLTKHKLFSFACNKIYQLEFLKREQLLFERTKLIEDFLFNIDAFGKVKKVQTIKDSLYYYRKPVHETLASQYNKDFFELSLRKHSLEISFLQSKDCNDPKIINLIQENMLKHLVSAIVRNRSAKANLSYRQQRIAIHNIVQNEQVKMIVREYKPRNCVYRIICSIVKYKMVSVLFLFAVVVDFSQTNLRPLYQRLIR